MFWTVVVFVLLLLVLKKFAWPAILGAVEAREQALEEQLAEAERDRARRRSCSAEHQSWSPSQAQAHGLVLAEARQLAEKERAVAMEKTKQEQEELLARARREIAAERDRAVAELRREAVDLSLAAASKLVGKRLDSETDRKIVLEYLATLDARPVRSETIARNYAEALFDLGERSGQHRPVRGAASTPWPRRSRPRPRCRPCSCRPGCPRRRRRGCSARPAGRPAGVRALPPGGGEARAAGAAARDRAEYQALLDVKLNRVRAGVTLARPADEALQESIAEALSRHSARKWLQSFSVDPEILGGAIVRVGERIHDGSLRRRLTKLRRQLL